MSDKEKTPVLDVARDKEPASDIITLSTGVRGRIRPVPAGLIDEVVSRIPDPEIPRQFIEEKGREELNPFDPTYIDAVGKASRARIEATLDAYALFGLELVDGIPDDGWLERLHFMEKRGRLDLSKYDLDDPLEREFVYKRFYALGSDDLELISHASGIGAKEVAAAVSRFPS